MGRVTSRCKSRVMEEYMFHIWEICPSMLGRGLHIASSGFAFGTVNLGSSVISTILSPIFCHSKHWRSEPNANPTTLRAKPSPGQLLLPCPKGINLNSSPPPSRLSNLSGLNFVGFGQILGSFWMAHIFTESIVPRGMRNPPTRHSSDDSWGISNGAAGYIRNVSFRMLRR